MISLISFNCSKNHGLIYLIWLNKCDLILIKLINYRWCGVLANTTIKLDFIYYLNCYNFASSSHNVHTYIHVYLHSLMQVSFAFDLNASI